MQSTNLPSKYLVPFAKNDGAKVELPVTTATAGRASQSLGFPPITGQPPEAGGLPPQLEDFNGAINQIARVAWWSMLGGLWRYDATFATDTNINGYPSGAELQSVADNRITWLSLVDNNTADPDATGTGWVPLTSYAPATIATAGGTTTPALPIVAHETLIVSGTLASNAVLILPVWTRGWTLTNTTTGAFTVTVKTAAGSGVVIPQNGAPTRVTGDGANILQLANNIAPGVAATQPLQVQQKGIARFTANGNWTCPVGVTTVYASGCGGGGGGGGSAAVGSPLGTGGGGGGGGAGQAIIRQAIAVIPGTIYPVVIGAGGIAGLAGGTPNPNNGGNGGNGGGTTFSTLSIAAGSGGFGGLTSTSTPAGGIGGGGFPGGSDGVDGTPNIQSGGGGGGAGGSGPFGGGGGSKRSGQGAGGAGYPAIGFGGGGGGGSAAYAATSVVGQAGGAGSPGMLNLEW